MTMRLLLLGMLISCGLNADTMMVNVEGINQRGFGVGFNGPISQVLVPQFDPALGDLQGVTLTIFDVNFSGTQTWNNTTNSVTQAYWQFVPILNYTAPDWPQFFGVPYPSIIAAPNPVAESTIAQPNSTATGGYASVFQPPPVTRTETLSPSTPLDVYIGNGTWAFSTQWQPDYTCPFCGQYEDPGMNLAGDIDTVNYRLTVTYDFVSAAVPEPSLSVVLGMLFVLGILAKLRYAKERSLLR